MAYPPPGRRHRDRLHRTPRVPGRFGGVPPSMGATGMPRPKCCFPSDIYRTSRPDSMALPFAGQRSDRMPTTTPAADLQAIVAEIHAELAPSFGAGKVADYIPQLAHVDPRRFGLAVVTLDGALHAAGEAEAPFSIQSISKVFLLTLALGRLGESLWTHVGREPSGTAFNSIVQLEAEHGIPRNPFINAGAIVVTDLVLAGHSPREAIGEILRFMRFLADDETIAIDAEVARSEVATGARNYALAHFMRSFGRLAHPVDQVLGVYFHHCAIAMSCRQLARAGLLPRRRRQEPADRELGGLRGAGPAHQRGDADLRPLRRLGRLRLSRRPARQERRRRRHPRRSRPARPRSRSGRRGSTPTATRSSAPAALEMLARRTGWSVFGA